MALKKSVKTIHGFDAMDAYHRVENVVIIEKTKLQFGTASYKDAPSKEFVIGVPAFSWHQYECSYDINGANPIAQAYAHLKTMPEFAGATDC